MFGIESVPIPGRRLCIAWRGEDNWDDAPTVIPITDILNISKFASEKYGQPFNRVYLPANLEAQPTAYLQHILYFHETYHRDDFTGDWPAIIERVSKELARRKVD